MPTYSNPYSYQSPIGEALGRLGKVLTSGPTEAQRISAAEGALKLKRQREGITRVADLFGQYGGDGFDRNAAASAAILGGVSPTDLAGMDRYLAANTYGAADPRTDNAARGAGGAYSSTAQAFFTDQGNQNARAANRLAEDARQFDMMPVETLVDGQPAFTARKDAFGLSPILSETERKGTLLGGAFDNLADLGPEQQRVLGADAGSRTPRNYVGVDGRNFITYDGLTDARTGEQLPDGHLASVQGSAKDTGLTTTTQTGLESADIANEKLRNLVGFAREQVGAMPDELFGVTGEAARLAQNAAIVATNVARGLNFDGPVQAMEEIQRDAAAKGVDQSILSGVFNPAFGGLDATYGLLVYATASALAGQSGRDLSNEDVKRAQEIVGDPRSILANKQTLLSKLDTIEKLAGLQQQTTDSRLGRAPAAPAADAGVEVWTRDANGNIVRGQ